MKYNLQISISKKPVDGGIVSYRQVTMRERLLSHLFGSLRRVVIIIPGDSVECVRVIELSKGGDESDGSADNNSGAPDANQSDTV